METAIFAQWLQTRTSVIKYANWNKGTAPGEVDIVCIDIAKQKAATSRLRVGNSQYEIRFGDFKQFS